MNKKIIFVTTNTGKFEELKRWAQELDSTVILEQAALDIPEYQSLDIKEVALGKAKEAWRLLQQPLLIDDGGLYLEQYNKFPGTLSKYVYEGIGLEGTWKLAENNPKAYFLCCLVYCDGPNSFYFFDAICKGTLIEPGHEITHVQLPYSSIFIPEGSTKPFSSLRNTEEEKKCHHRYKALKDFINWFEHTLI